jgi:heavy metal sensor kinase
VEEVRFRELHIAILDSAGKIVAMNALAEDDQDASSTRRPSQDVQSQLLAAVRARDHGDAVALTLPSARGNFRVRSQPIDADRQHFTLTGVYSLRDIDEVLDRVREIFLVAIPLLLVAASLGGYALARRSLAPVAAMSMQASAISARNLHERLPVGGGDELVGLSSMVNGLLDRLQSSFEQQRRFIADASHELRTPTAVVRTEADITLAREHRAEPEYRASISVMQDASRRLTRIVDDLFLLSRADSGHLVMRDEPLYLEELVDDATRAVRSVAHQRGVEIDVREIVAAPSHGDADLLGRLLLNLLDNAIKYSPAGGKVVVSMAAAAERCTISVVDEGAGIPPEMQSRVFERFFRVDSARTRAETSATSGAGLGLAIAQRIAEMHAGRVELAGSRPGRTEFRVTLPVG